MDAENKTNLPSGSVDAISDESVKATKWAFQATTSTPNRSNDLKAVSGLAGIRGCEVVTINSEKNGSISMTAVPPDGGAQEIVAADQPLPDSEWQISYKKAIGFFKATMVTESAGGDNKEKLFKLVNFPSAIEKEDVEIAVDQRKVVLNLITGLEELGEVKRTEELPFDATGSAVSTFLEGGTFVVKFTFEKLGPKEKLKSKISEIWGSAKGTLTKAVPGCLVICGKIVVDETNNDEPKAEPNAEGE